MAVSRAHVRWVRLAAGLAAVTAALLLVGPDRVLGVFDSFTRTAPEESAGPLLEGAATASGSTEGPTLEGARRSATPDPSAGTRGPLRVTLLDTTGAPIAGARLGLLVLARGEEGNHVSTREGLSDGGGQAWFADVPYDGSAQATATYQDVGSEDVLGPEPLPRAEFRIEGTTVYLHPVHTDTPIAFSDVTPELLAQNSHAHAAVTGPEVTLTLDCGLPFEVDVRDAQDGRPRSAPWQVTPRLEWAPDALESPRLAVRRGQDTSIRLKVDPPRGSLAPPTVPWAVWIHSQAQRLVAVAPLRPEVEVLAEFPPEVRPIRADDWDLTANLGSRPLLSLRAEARRDGLVAVDGFPHLVGELIHLGGTVAGVWDVRGTAVLGPDPRARVVVRMTCVRREPQALDSIDVGTISLGHLDRVHPGLTFRVVEGTQLSLSLERIGFPAFGPFWDKAGDVRLRVRLPNGRPAVGALVRGVWGVASTDAEGFALLRGVGGDAVATIQGAGAVTRVTLQPVAPRETTDAEARGTLGGEIEVVVVDELERALPFATLAVEQPSGLPWADLDGDVQRIDPYTDERGRRTLHLVEPGKVKVKATFGSRTAGAEVEVLEGETARVRLVLPAADAPAKEPAEELAAER